MSKQGTSSLPYSDTPVKGNYHITMEWGYNSDIHSNTFSLPHTIMKLLPRMSKCRSSTIFTRALTRSIVVSSCSYGVILHIAAKTSVFRVSESYSDTSDRTPWMGIDTSQSLCQHRTKQHTSAPRVGFENIFPLFEQQKTNSLRSLCSSGRSSFRMQHTAT
jgi:hypothetical protein